MTKPPDAPIILTAMMGDADLAWANQQRQLYFPLERNFLKAHITLFHHLPPQHWPEIKESVKRQVMEAAPLVASITGLINLGTGVAYRVECPELMAIRMMLAQQFHGLLIPQDQAKPRLHITIQNKATPRAAKQLLQKLEADFKLRPLQITGISAHIYRGGPWQALSNWKFRG